MKERSSAFSEALHTLIAMSPYAGPDKDLRMSDSSAIHPSVLNGAAAVIKVIGHPLRLRLLEAMEVGERTVTELQDVTGSSQSMVSQQLGILRGRGVVDARRDGTHVYYRITEPKVHRILACIRECDASGHVPGRSA
jgi:ArsR family transcriptional regulator